MLKNTFLIIVIMIIISHAQTIINVGIGPSWPSEIKGSEKKIAWNGTIEYGKIFDNIIGIGVDVDFSWWINDEYVKSTVLDTLTNETSVVSKKVSDDKYFMFPISAVLFVDPIPKFKVHPVIRAQIGLNMMTRDREELVGDDMVESDVSDGFYIGVIGKGGADAVVDLGEHAAVYAGFEYQWGKLRHKITDGPRKDDYTYFKFNAPMIRMGLSVLF